MTSQIAGEIKDFDVSKFIPAKEARRMDRFIHYGLAAAIEAIGDSGLKATPDNAERIGVIIGSGIGGLPMIRERSSTWFPATCRSCTASRGRISRWSLPARQQPIASAKPGA
jgi:3-oxoacyl-[acyl-carrier-protein] synthase II